jgi:hypothetical protein
MVQKKGQTMQKEFWNTRIDKLPSPDDTVFMAEASFGKTMSRVTIEIVRNWIWK